MALFKRGGTYTSYVWFQGVRDAKATGTGNRRIAEALDRQHKDELVMQRLREPKLKPDMLFCELEARFIAEGMAKPYLLDRLKHLRPFYERLQLQDIDKSSVRRYRQQRHAASTLTVATVNRDLSALRRLMYWAQEEGFIAANPLGRMRMERERRTKKPVLSVREELLLMAAASPHLRRIILCALDTGMRKGEICAQRWDDVDFDNQLLHVSHSKTPEGEMREIPLTVRLYSELRNLKAIGPFVFMYEGEPLKYLKTTWAGTLRRSGIRHFRFHDLRHTANTRLMLAGVMQEVRRELIGHSSRHSRDVNDRYTQIELPEKRDAIQKLDTWLAAQFAQLAATTTAPPAEPSQRTEGGSDEDRKEAA